MYKDKYMQQVYTEYSEMILVDATYKLLHLHLPVYLIMINDYQTTDIAKHCVYLSW